jgi:hypothetical protein
MKGDSSRLLLEMQFSTLEDIQSQLMVEQENSIDYSLFNSLNLFCNSYQEELHLPVKIFLEG